MFNPIKRIAQSPSIAIATVAVALAAGSSATAASSLIGSAQVKNNSLTTSDMKDKSLRGSDLRDKTLTLAKISDSTRDSLRGQQGPQGATGPTGLQGPAGDPATKMFAVVNADSTLARGSHVVSTDRVGGGDGSYEIVFDRDVSTCAWISQIGKPDTTSTSVGFIRQALRTGNPNAVFIGTYSTAPAAADRPFHLVVVC